MRNLPRLSTFAAVTVVAGVGVATMIVMTIAAGQFTAGAAGRLLVASLLVGGAALVAVRLAPAGADAGRAEDGLRELVGRFSADTTTLAETSAQLAAQNTHFGDGVEEARRSAGRAEETARGASGVIASSSVAVAEIGKSTESIARTVAEATKVAAEAVQIAESTNQVVAKLGESSTEIGNVVKVIASIAGQTNLLALNATIEASRVGEVGKGFAVVATEVKELAQQTGQATEEISRRIAAIQGDAAEAVGAMWQIDSVIEQISDFQRAIANAVREQMTVAGEVGRDTAAAASASSDVADAFVAVASALERSRQAAGESARLVGAVTSLTQDLAQSVRVSGTSG